MVEIQAPSSARARSWRPSSRRRARIRPRSSAGGALRVRDHEDRVDVEALARRPPATKRSTSTVVFPVPAPAETKTWPRAAIAAACCSFGALGLAAVMRASPGTSARGRTTPGSRRPSGRAARRRRGSGRASLAPAPWRPRPGPRTRPRRGSRSSRSRAARRPCASARSSPRALALARERPVEPAERLDPDEVAQHEHVERDLEPQLLLDLGGGVAGAPRTCSPGRSRAR